MRELQKEGDCFNREVSCKSKKNKINFSKALKLTLAYRSISGQSHGLEDLVPERVPRLTFLSSTLRMGMSIL